MREEWLKPVLCGDEGALMSQRRLSSAGNRHGRYLLQHRRQIVGEQAGE